MKIVEITDKTVLLKRNIMQENGFFVLRGNPIVGCKIEGQIFQIEGGRWRISMVDEDNSAPNGEGWFHIVKRKFFKTQEEAIKAILTIQQERKMAR